MIYLLESAKKHIVPLMISKDKKLHFYSKSHQDFIESLFKRIKSYYADHLVSLVIFGSYARGENRLNSDLDLLLILDSTQEMRRLKIQEEFVKQIEMPLEEKREACAKEGIHSEISSMILSQDQAKHFNPIYLDMVSHHLIIFDLESFFVKILEQVEEKMHRWGSKRREIGGNWYWEIRPGLGWKETIHYDQ